MSDKHDKEELREEELENEAMEDADIFEEQEEIIEEQQEEIVSENEEINRLKDLLARQQADNENFKKRVERDKQDMLFFLKSDIFKKILPRVDDMERILTNTPKDLQDNALFDWLQTTYKSLIKDLEKMSVKAFNSKGESVDPDKHDVMTQVPWEEGVIIDEFEKGYMLGEKVLRHAKVVVESGI